MTDRITGLSKQVQFFPCQPYQCVLEKWRETSVGAMWNQLIEALKRIQLDYFVSELEKKLKPECKIIAMYLLQMPSCTGA